jgi:SAM-dependent methyltransferase
MGNRPDFVARTTDAYERGAGAFIRRWGGRTTGCPALLRELLALAGPRAALLDLGCGAGQDARYLFARRHHSVGHVIGHVIGLDRAWALLAHARRHSRRVPLVQGDMRRLPFKSGSFDAVWAAASLIHLPRAEASRLLRALRACVPVGGLLAATVAHGRRAGFLRRGWIPGRYFARWKKAQLERAVCRAGWEVVALVTVTGRERKGRWLNLVARRRR